MNKTEYSKIIISFLTAFVTIITAYSFILMWKTNDASPLAYLIPSAFGAYGTSICFYYWKAKTENKIKLLKIYGEDAEKAFSKDNDMEY